ncbi:hypothetical protein ALC60_04159 [Trachymyrmex zeteki]|uniref:Uncharacterized protein n=1 Tax=Mycetomoellerius zeteki TaxID=64791 RepID=A0A151X993_9HYME|nr:hypothetical protein ALC60_04159 [Trachymyrmex zeteki]
MVPVPLFRLRSRIADRCTSSSTPCAGERARLVTYLMLRFTPGYFPPTITSAALWICRCDNKASGCSGRRVREQKEEQEDEQEETAEAPLPPPPPTSVLFRCYRLSCSSCQVPDTGCWLLVRHTGRAAINW